MKPAPTEGRVWVESGFLPSAEQGKGSVRVWADMVGEGVAPILDFPRRKGRDLEGCAVLSFHGGLVVVYHLAGDGYPGVLINVGAAIVAELAAEIGVFNEVGEGGGEALAVLRGGEEALIAVGDDVGVALDAGGDDGF